MPVPRGDRLVLGKSEQVLVSQQLGLHGSKRQKKARAGIRHSAGSVGADLLRVSYRF